MKTLKGQKRVKDKIGIEVHCYDPRGEAKEETVILNEKTCNPLWRQKQPPRHHLSPLLTFDTDDPL